MRKKILNSKKLKTYKYRQPQGCFWYMWFIYSLLHTSLIAISFYWQPEEMYKYVSIGCTSMLFLSRNALYCKVICVGEISTQSNVWNLRSFGHKMCKIPCTVKIFPREFNSSWTNILPQDPLHTLVFLNRVYKLLWLSRVVK
jgi:hypothetical protein